MRFNGLRVVRERNTVFVPLPVEAQSPISGGCGCDFCKSHPDRKPMWDTLVLADNPTTARKRKQSDTTHVCHYPEIH